ncbi:hypothetical protein [Streptomyces sp. NPDC058872]|uniref:hypothetical protein n=1 Tax=Streptomyces sp. NPDC058872 TaxID=3346661 RepID=UPI003677DC49
MSRSSAWGRFHEWPLRERLFVALVAYTTVFLLLLLFLPLRHAAVICAPFSGFFVLLVGRGPGRQ